MYKCKECGKVYESLEDAREEVETVEYGDRTYNERYCVCHCGGELEEVYKCKICGDITESKICEKCLTLEKCFEVGEEHRQCLELNGFVANMFTTSEIEEILMRELKEAQELGITNKYDLEDYLESI